MECNVAPCDISDGGYLYISYAHSDNKLVYPVIETIDGWGYKLWYDGGIGISENWTDEIANAIVGSSAFIVFLTENSAASQYVQEEILFALESKIKIIPIYIDEDLKLPPGVKMRLQSIQGIMATSQDKRKVIENRLNDTLNRLGIPTAARAPEILPSPPPDEPADADAGADAPAKTTQSKAKFNMMPFVAAAFAAVILIAAGFIYAQNASATLEVRPQVVTISLGSSSDLVVERHMPNGSSTVLENSQIRWDFSAEDVVRIDGNRISGMSVGEAELTGRYRSSSISLSVRVVEPIDGMVDISQRYIPGRMVTLFAGEVARGSLGNTHEAD